MNVPSSQSVYRAPYVYFCQTAESTGIVRIGSTMRPVYELQRLQKRYANPLALLAYVRAYAVLAPILWARFERCAVGRQWFKPDRRLMHLVHAVNERNPEALISVDELRALFEAVFPEDPYIGVAQYRLSETYIRRTRVSTYFPRLTMGK